MTINALDQFYLTQQAETRDCFLALKTIILNFHKEISPEWKYKLPFFYYRAKPLCYLWFHKKHQQPYIGFVDGKLIDHPSLLLENRTRIKILLIKQHENLPLAIIKTILSQAIKTNQEKYHSGLKPMK